MDFAEGTFIFLAYLILAIGFNYFVIFYIFKIAKEKQNRTVKLFLSSLLIGILGSASILVLEMLPETIKENSILPILILYGIPILTTFLVVRFVLSVKILISIILGTLYFIIYYLANIPLFLTIGCMDSEDPNCETPVIFAGIVIFLILYLSLLAYLYFKEKKSVKSSR